MKRRRRKWKAPNNPTIPAKQIWRAIYDEPWPKGWRVEWAGFMRGALGLTLWSERRILLSYSDLARVGKPKRVKRGTVMTRSHADGRVEKISGGDIIPGLVHSPDGGAVKTLVHEFVHVRFVGLRHGAEFERLVAWGWKKLMNADGSTKHGTDKPVAKKPAKDMAALLNKATA